MLSSSINSPSQWTSFELLQGVLDTIPDPIFVKNLQHHWIACNRAFCALIGHPYEAIIGYSDPDLWPPEQAAVFWQGDDAVFESGQPHESEEVATGSDGIRRFIWTRKFPMRDDLGQVVGLSGIIIDITSIRQRQEEIARLEAALSEQQTELAVKEREIAAQVQIIGAQNTLLTQLSVPVIQVWGHILLLPLVGNLDRGRAEQVLKNLLAAVAQHHAHVTILDVTGVLVIDTAVASMLLQAMRGLQLLGCRSVLVGIRPEMAQTIVDLGIDFSAITTRATLHAGLAWALQQTR